MLRRLPLLFQTIYISDPSTIYLRKTHPSYGGSGDIFGFGSWHRTSSTPNGGISFSSSVSLPHMLGEIGPNSY